MIIFDANILISVSSLSENDPAYEKIAGLIQDIVNARTVIGVPSPAWAEFLCGADVATSDVVNALKKRGSIRILPFDEVAAFEASLIFRGAIASGKKKGSSKAPWQGVKVDRQILAIARQHNVKTIYTDDEDMAAEAARLGIEAIATADLPLKPKQTVLEFGDEDSPQDAP